MGLKSRISLFAAVIVCASASAAFAEQVDNPLFVAWSRCKPGSTVTIEQSMDIDSKDIPDAARKMTITTKSKLLEIAEDHVVIEATTTMITNDKTTEQPATKVTIPAKVEKGMELLNGMDKMLGDKPVIKDVKEGKDTIEVLGKKVEVTTREFSLEGVTNGEKIAGTMKVWYSAEIPSGVAKLLFNVRVPLPIVDNLTVTEFHFEK